MNRFSEFSPPPRPPPPSVYSVPSVPSASSAPSALLPLPPDVYDYHVGWICESTRDYGAVCKILDEEQQLSTMPLKPSSRTPYKLARIERHNVVINIPPRDSTTESLPLNVARGLIAQFPLIRFFLMVGSGGAAHSTGGSIKIGDVVIGSKVIPYNILDNKKRRNPDVEILQLPSYLSSTLTVLFHERDFDGWRLQRTMDKVMTRFPSHNRRYGRPQDPFVNLVGGHVGFQSNSPHHRPEFESEHSPPNRSIEVFQGTVVSMTGRKDEDIGIGEQKSLTDNILCVEHGSAEILGAGISCLPILGINRDARNQGSQHNDWSHYAAFAAAVCSKEVLASITPEVVAQAPSTMSSKDVEVMMKENVKGMNRVLQEACRLNQPHRILQAAQIAEKRIDELEVWMHNLSDSVHHHANQQLIDVQTEMEKIKKTEEDMQRDMKDMHNRIEALKQDPSNARIRDELAFLQNTVKENSSRLQDLSNFTAGAVTIAVDVLEKVAQDTGNKDVESARQWLAFVTRYRGLLDTFGRKNVKSTASADKTVPQAVSHGEASSGAEKSSTHENIGKRFISKLPLGIWDNRRSTPTGSCDITANMTQNRLGPKNPIPEITKPSIPSSMSSSHTGPRTQSSHLPDSVTSRTSVSSRGQEEDPSHSPIDSHVSLHRSHTDSELGHPQLNRPIPAASNLSPRTLRPSVGSTNEYGIDVERPASVRQPTAPSLPLRTLRPSVGSTNESGVDIERPASVRRLAAQFNQSGRLMGQPQQGPSHRRGGNHNS